MINMLLDGMARAFTGKTLDQIELDSALRSKFQQARDSLPPILTELQAIAHSLGATDFWTDGFSVDTGKKFSRVLQTPRGQQLWQYFLISSATMNGLAGVAKQSNDPLYTATYQEMLKLRKAVGNK